MLADKLSVKLHDWVLNSSTGEVFDFLLRLNLDASVEPFVLIVSGHGGVHTALVL